jgi:DNA-binding response OmpR family regulator
MTKPPTSILVVDDHPAVLEGLRIALEGAGYEVLLAKDGVEALDVLQSQPVDLILADIAMPRMNGYQLYERVRENPEWFMLPFLFLSARTLDSDVRYGKGLGVDDYLTKPVDPADLLAVIQGKLQRAHQMAEQMTARLSAQVAQPQAKEVPALMVGGLQIDPSQREVWMDGQPIKLSAREFTLLDYMARRTGKVVPHTELIQASHGLDTDAIEAGALLRPFIRSLRRKLGYSAGEMGCIQNVRGVGYRLVALTRE